MTDGTTNDPAASEEKPGWRAPVRIDGPTDPAAAHTHLVVGFDRHPSSHAALDYAIDLAARLDAFLHVAHVIDTDNLPIDPDSAYWEQTITDSIEHDRRAACARLEHAPGPWAYYSRPGRPAHMLAGLADTHDAEMIIIGTARSGLVALLHRLSGESVSRQLIHRAHRPVLLVSEPPTAPR